MQLSNFSTPFERKILAFNGAFVVVNDNLDENYVENNYIFMKH